MTAKKDPEDVDAVLFLPPDFGQQVERGGLEAVELEDMLLTRQPEELFAAEDEADWQAWVDFFTRTREPDGRQKGVVEIQPMIETAQEYQKAQDELRHLERWLERLQQDHPVPAKGLTKAGIRKMIARLHEELAVYEGSQEVKQSETSP